MKILITGSSGFIGSSLYHFLKSLKYDVFGIDYIMSNTCDKIMDLQKEYSYLDALVLQSDLVIHLAASVGVDDLKDERNFFNNSYNIDKNILELVKNYQKKIIYTSTSEVYGDCIVAKETSDFGVVKNSNRSCYAIQKLNSEFYIKYNIKDYCILRPFNIVGRNQNPHKSVIHKFIRHAKNDENIEIFRDKNNHMEASRQFCDIFDFCNFVKSIIDKNLTGVYNIGNPNNDISMTDLAKRIIKLTSSKSVIEYKHWPYEYHDIISRSGSFDNIIKDTGYTPVYNIRDILENILNF